MNLLLQTAPENRFTARESSIVAQVSTHMDTWIDRMCERTDELLQAYGCIPGTQTQEGQTAIKEKRAA
jgi:hypothetical protein